MAASTVQNAIAAYRVAAAYHHDVGVHSINLPGRVEETQPGVYRLWPHEEPDASGRFTGSLAICTYDADAERWTVELHLEEKTTTVVWSEEEEQYTVVE